MSEYEELGTQFDGEPVAVVPEEPKPDMTEDPKPAPESEEPPAEGADAAEAEEEAKHKKSGLVRERERRIRAEARLELLEQQAAMKQPEVKPVLPQIGRPDPNDYPSQEDWVEAVSEWKANQRIQAVRAEEQGKTLQRTWNQKVAEGKAKFPDLIEVMEEAETPSRVVAKLLVSPKVPIDVAHYLATHPEEYRVINRMDAEDAGLEIAEIKAKLSAPKPQKPTTKAPPPVTPVAPSGVIPSTGQRGGIEEF